MNAIAEGKGKKKRRSRIPAGLPGARLVVDELLKRGFDARLPDRPTRKYDVLVGPGSPSQTLHVRAVHVGPWYVRTSHFAGASANQVTVYVLLGFERKPERARFFVTRNSNVEANLRQPPNWRKFGLIDIEAIRQYEDNWDLLKEYHTN